MAHYQRMGSVPHKRHTQHRRPSSRGKQGALYYEELMGEEGFSSDSSLLYHRNIPSTIADSREWSIGDLSTDAEPSAGPAAPAPARPVRRGGGATDRPGDRTAAGPRQRRRAHLVCGVGARRVPGTATGSATSASSWSGAGHGSRRCSARSTSVRATTWSSRGRRRTAGFRAGRRGIPCARMRSRPTRTSRRRSGTCRSTASSSSTRRTASGTCGSRPGRCWPRTWGRGLRTRPRCSSSTAGRDPGASSAPCIRCRSTRSTSWAGTGASTPTSSTSRDFEPITGRVHQPPPVHQVFEGWNFVICNFVPRKVDYHPLSIPVPYYHSNVDSDEIMFYVDGDYEARKGSGIGKGSISVHPGGHPHGPQPGATEGSHRRPLLRRAGRHGRHVPTAGARRGRTRGRRRPVRPQLAPRLRPPRSRRTPVPRLTPSHHRHPASTPPPPRGLPATSRTCLSCSHGRGQIATTTQTCPRSRVVESGRSTRPVDKQRAGMRGSSKIAAWRRWAGWI